MKSENEHPKPAGEYIMIKLPNNFVASGKAEIHYSPPYHDNYKDFNPYGWYISIDCEYIDGSRYTDIDCFYLHSDGKWRHSTVNSNGEFTAYYKTKEDAIAALNSING